jgi:exopolysaccharide biosynthesis polyprenyl glycosylphosphotransferase
MTQVTENFAPPLSSVDLALLEPEILGAKAHRPAASRMLAAADLLAITLAMVAAAIVRPDLFGAGEGPVGVWASLRVELAYVPVFFLALAVYGAYRRARRRLRPTAFLDMGCIGHGLALGCIATMVISALGRRAFGWHRLGWVEVTCIAVFTLALVPMVRSAVTYVTRGTGTRPMRVLVVGSGDLTSGVIRRLRVVKECEVIGYVDDPDVTSGRPTSGRWLGGISSLVDACRIYEVDRVVIAFGGASLEPVVDAVRRLPPSIRVSLVPRMFELVTWQSRVEELYGLTVMDVPPASLGRGQRIAKRSIDLLGATLALVAGAIPLVAIAVAIKVTSPGPLFFRQERCGRGGRTFRIYKFRSMSVDAETQKHGLASDRLDTLFKLALDPRITRVGAFLRRTSLDELPQLLNVLKGDMSLVGPRPFIPSESQLDGWAARRFDVRPGMTGLWQVSGRSDLPVSELRQLDYSYVASWSLLWDLKILWHTPSSVLRGTGAY